MVLRCLEPLAIFLLIEYYIWVLRAAHRLFWIPILVLIVVSHLVRRERPSALGFRTKDLSKWLRGYGALLIFVGLAGVGRGLVLQTIRPIPVQQAVLAFAAYVPWGIFQEYLLNGYFLRRFDAVLPRRQSAVLTAGLFAMAHAPNWFLMAVGLAGGYAAIQLYRRCQNLYFVGLVHAVAGFLLYLVVPDSISHHLNVGPGH